ncbi:ADP-ribosylation factor 13A [Pelobates cultripes]|uniref:ADP-ribosylation factor 13A n=2 Tax=Pelobates cultripes TaxID=61616 RepID=A0AAD1T5F9_PELCU|nr:ADP-ribosylation factor 13A [Pelobates cultripes]
MPIGSQPARNSLAPPELLPPLWLEDEEVFLLCRFRERAPEMAPCGCLSAVVLLRWVIVARRLFFEASSVTADPLRTELRLDRFDVTLLELPGGQKARANWRLHYSHAHALIFVIDSSDPGRMAEVGSALASVLRHPRMAGKPLLILANKQDKACSLLPSEIIELLSLEPLVNENKTLCRIEPCSAATDFRCEHDWAILKGLRWILRSVTLSYPILSSRVLQDIIEQRESLHLRASGRIQDDMAIQGWDVPHDSITDLVKYKTLPGGKKRTLKPIQNMLTQTSHSLSTVKKRKRKVRVKESSVPQAVKKREDEKETESKQRVTEHRTSPSITTQHAHMGHRTVVQPESQQSNQANGSRKKKKKRKAILKNQIKSQEGGACADDMSNTFDLYRRAMQALKLKQQQQRERTVCGNQEVNPLQ